jgi:hypothetical protein
VRGRRESRYPRGDTLPILSLSQPTIRVDVAFYNNAEREKLLRFPTAPVMQELVSNPVEVPTAEFLSYYLYHRKRLGTPAYQDHQSIGRRLHVAIAHLEDCIDSNGHSIRTAAGAERQLNEVSEHTGEAVGLCVLSRIHQLSLTEADWAPIRAQGGPRAVPTFDFQRASDGRHLVQVETKGSSVSDNRVRGSEVRAQKRRIVEKKAQLTELAVTGSDPYPASLRYGTITVVDPRTEGNVRCWLTDPPPDEIDVDPRRSRLLQRMRFLRDWISFISGRSPFAAALSTRVADLEAMQDPFELDGVRLLRGNGRAFEAGAPSLFRTRSSFLANKSRITDGPPVAWSYNFQTAPCFWRVSARTSLLWRPSRALKQLAVIGAEWGRWKRASSVFSAGGASSLFAFRHPFAREWMKRLPTRRSG